MNNKYRVWCLRNNCWHPGEGNVPTYYDAALAFSEQVADTEVREYPTPPAKVEGEWTYKFDDDDNRFCLVKPDGDWILSLFVDSVDPSSDRMVNNTVDAINTLAAENARLRAALEFATGALKYLSDAGVRFPHDPSAAIVMREYAAESVKYIAGDTP